MTPAPRFLAISLVITGFAFPAGAQLPTVETIANWQGDRNDNPAKVYAGSRTSRER